MVLSSAILCQIIHVLIDAGHVEVIMAAVPCGTSSRALEIPIKGGPTPMRSEEFPRGLPGLNAVQQLRVSKANDIYDNVAVIFDHMISIGGLCGVENPWRSWLWSFTYYRNLLERGFTMPCSNIASGPQIRK